MLFVALLTSGCATPASRSTAERSTERGPDGTVAYYVPVESSEPDTKIEVNYEMVGTAPLKLKIWGDTDGTFHNFASYDYIVRAYPARQGLAPQIKHFRCGGLFQQEDIIPSKIVFYFGKPEAK